MTKINLTNVNLSPSVIIENTDTITTPFTTNFDNMGFFKLSDNVFGSRENGSNSGENKIHAYNESITLVTRTNIPQPNSTSLAWLLDNYNDTLSYNTSPYYDFGPQRDSLKIVIPVTIIYTLIFITGVIGNIGTCIVIKKNRSMHTATNYYLFSLAISDFLLLISGVPQEMYFIWSKYPYIFGEFFCIGRGVVAETSANATVLTITAFTVERYVGICHPFLGQAMSKLSRAIRIIVLIWILSILTAIPQAAQFGIIIFSGVEKCSVVRNIIEHSFQLSTFIFFLAPMSIIVVLYLLIGLKLYRSDLIINAGDAKSVGDDKKTACERLNSNKGTNRGDTVLYRYSGGTQLSAVRGRGRGRSSHFGTKRVLKMLVAVVICFFLCWAPFHAQRLIAIYGTDVIVGGGTDDSTGSEELDTNNHEEIIYTVMTYVSGVLYYLSTCINPLLYNIMSNKFREAFKAILFRKKAKGSINSRRTQESRRLRRNATLTSTTQRESSETELVSKHSVLQAVVQEKNETI
ncbi:pyrokinin-1 receptor [Teleopsis dalmanni]|uniref:pyrokinin-1 receptor n=1 Tax=Teleopsis dalmanni TaxID=139649 RepID=UPI0018CDC8D3|nr:pyrokinin-1 receptor [Teleopsis dalmanni]